MISILIKKPGEGSFTDRTNQIAHVQITQGATKEATTANLVVNFYGDKYQPGGEDEVEIYDGATKIFGGFIVRAEQRLIQGHVVIYECDLKNKVYRLDYKLVNSTYEKETAHDIIEDIVANFSGPGITTTNVENDLSAEMEQISFNNVPASEAIQQLADIFNKEWYVDPDGDIHFFSKFAEAAPFDLTDTGGKYVFDSLVVSDDYTQIRNSILVEGGEEKSTEDESDTFVGNGVQYTFALSRKYTGIAVTLDGSPLTVGIANINSFDDYDCLYDFNLRSLSFDPTNPPGNGLELVVTGKYFFPIAVRFREGTSIGTYGERQFLIQDKQIKSRTDAVARASAEISAFSSKVSEGKFTTHESGLQAGQKITIQSDARGIKKEFVIQRLTGKLVSPSLFEWDAEIVSVKTYELIDLLAQIIKGKRIEVSADAVIQNAERVNRTVEVSRTISVRTPVEVARDILIARDYRTYLNNPPIWVAGPFVPPDIDDRRRVAFADRRCEAS